MERAFEYQSHWLVRRSDTVNWYIYWCRPGTRRVERRSTGTSDLEQAKRELIAFAERQSRVSAIAPPTPPSPLNLPPTITTSAAEPPHSLDIGRLVPVLDVVAAYVDRLEGRGSYEAACNALRAWIEFCEHFNIVYVHEMTLSVQEQFVAWRRRSHPLGKPLSNGTINRGLDVLRAACRDAWRRGQLATVPFIQLVPKPPPRDKFLTQDEVQRLLAACEEPHLYRFVLLAAHTLQRPSAILGLRIEQVDLAWNRINFLPPGGVQTNKRRPIVPITTALRPMLEQAITETESGFVIEYRGQRLRKIKRAFASAVQRAGLPEGTPGILRHTGATLLAAAGVPLREISGMLGHTTSHITEAVYAKRRPEFLREASSKLDQLFTPKSQPAGNVTQHETA